MYKLLLKSSLTSFAFLFTTAAAVNAQNIGIGTTNPRVPVHVVSGAEGNMGFPYETVVVEKSEDSKLGIYSTSPNPTNFKAASVALGFTNYTDAQGNYPGYEMQFGEWSNAGFILRFNALSRNASGNYLVNQTYSNILCLDRTGRVGINLTQGQPVAPLRPSANLHVNGSVRFQNLPQATAGGNYLLIDTNGNLVVSSDFSAIRPVSNPGVEINAEDIRVLKEEITLLKQKVASLERIINRSE